MEKTVYIQMKHRLTIQKGASVKLGDMAQIIVPEGMNNLYEMVVLSNTSEVEKKFIVLDVMNVINKIKSRYPDSDIQVIGPSETIFEITEKRKTAPFLLFVLVWLLLFVGSGLAIMNFHEETSMQAMHQKIYWMMTGKMNTTPYIVQIPYSLGLGLGMILFFNHLFKKRINEEPSPLEIEMFNYQQDLDQYVVLNKHKESTKYSDDY
ncbi:stage V sporulation protein AA [Siminovitchia fortis]|uniref:Stage V sporulation protein AA n=1 Tax=Siminovitchia fortis TaxID=254758 RepID=A0A443J3Z6_9BACI|nr:stage V sporulation protein AA [Siminovitchia fortis]RWR15278.1 stage V sporulation protein AA [Siminovitchia fortis]WHY83667.1 stage V sporulation protein AA [Siminovitchia fortis]